MGAGLARWQGLAPQHPSQPVAPASPRLRFLDAARGCALLFVFISHFGDVYRFEANSPVPNLLRDIGLVASPTFITISGMLIGFFSTARSRDFQRIQVRFVDRGLFLLTIAHVLLMGAHRLSERSWPTTLFITDVVGICMLVQPWLLVHVRTQTRLVLAAAAYGLSWTLVQSWSPQTAGALWFKQTIFGSFEPAFFAFPLLPWLSADIVATVLGQRVGRLYVTNRVNEVPEFLFKTGILAIVTSLALRAVLYVVTMAHLVSGEHLEMLTYLLKARKEPPSPVYLLFFGGLGLCVLVVGCFHAERRPSNRSLFDAIASLGQTSLTAFVIQEHVYYALLRTARVALPTGAWPLLLPLSMAVIVTLSLTWFRRGWNNRITVGFGRWWGPGIKASLENSDRERLLWPSTLTDGSKVPFPR
jgi:uncharacterized membrane protein